MDIQVLDLHADAQWLNGILFVVAFFGFFLLNLGWIIQKTKQKKDLATASAFPVFVDPVQNKEEMRGGRGENNNKTRKSLKEKLLKKSAPGHKTSVMPNTVSLPRSPNPTNFHVARLAVHRSLVSKTKKKKEKQSCPVVFITALLLPFIPPSGTFIVLLHHCRTKERRTKSDVNTDAKSCSNKENHSAAVPFEFT